MKPDLHDREWGRPYCKFSANEIAAVENAFALRSGTSAPKRGSDLDSFNMAIDRSIS